MIKKAKYLLRLAKQWQNLQNEQQETYRKYIIRLEALQKQIEFIETLSGDEADRFCDLRNMAQDAVENQQYERASSLRGLIISEFGV